MKNRDSIPHPTANLAHAKCSTLWRAAPCVLALHPGQWEKGMSGKSRAIDMRRVGGERRRRDEWHRWMVPHPHARTIGGGSVSRQVCVVVLAVYTARKFCSSL